MNKTMYNVYMMTNYHIAILIFSTIGFLKCMINANKNRVFISYDENIHTFVFPPPTCNQHCDAKKLFNKMNK